MGLDNPLHIAFLVVILLLVFGAKRLPEIGRSLGSGMREFKDSVSGESKQTRFRRDRSSSRLQRPRPRPRSQRLSRSRRPAEATPAR